MARKTRLCQEIWQRQVHTQPSLHVLLSCCAVVLCFAVMLCCCALLLLCFAVMLCLSFSRCAQFCPFSFACLALAVIGGRPCGSPEDAMPLLWVKYSFFGFFSYLYQSVLNEFFEFSWLAEQCSRLYSVFRRTKSNPEEYGVLCFVKITKNILYCFFLFFSSFSCIGCLSRAVLCIMLPNPGKVA